MATVLNPLTTSTPLEKVKKRKKQKEGPYNDKATPAKKTKMSANSTGYYTQESSTTATPVESMKREKKKRKKKKKSSPEVFSSPEETLSVSQVVTPDKPPPIMSLAKSAHVRDNDGWTQDQLECLLNNIKQQLPKSDVKSYLYRLKKINWENMEIEGVTPAMCMQKWSQLQSKVRHLRTLGELVEDLFHQDEVLHPERAGMPKKPLSVYIRFSMDYRKKHKNIALSEVSAAYAKMSEKKRKKFEKSYQDDMEKYNAELEAFKKANPGLFVTKQRTHHHHSHGDKPMHPLSAHQLYINHQVERALEKKPKCNKKKETEDSRKAWYELKDKKKIRWINKALEMEKEYMEKVAEYSRLHPEYSAKPTKSILTKNERKIKDKSDGILKKPLSAWSLFTAETLPKLSDLPVRDRMGECAKRWQSLSDEEKQKYLSKAAKSKEKYQKYYDGLSETEKLKLKENTKPRKKKTVVAPKTEDDEVEENQSRITNYFRSNSKEDDSGSDSESDMSDVLPIQSARTPKTEKTTTSSSESASSSDVKDKKAKKKHVTLPKKTYTNIVAKKDNSTSGSSSSSESDSDSESEESVSMKTPSPTKKLKVSPGKEKTPVTPLTVPRPLPPKTPAPTKDDLSSSSSSSSGSSSESSSESEDDEDDKAVSMLPTVKSPYSAAISKVSNSSSSSSSDSENEEEKNNSTAKIKKEAVSPVKKTALESPRKPLTQKPVKSVTKSPKNSKSSPTKTPVISSSSESSSGSDSDSDSD